MENKPEIVQPSQILTDDEYLMLCRIRDRNAVMKRGFAYIPAEQIEAVTASGTKAMELHRTLKWMRRKLKTISENALKAMEQNPAQYAKYEAISKRAFESLCELRNPAHIDIAPMRKLIADNEQLWKG